jgi:phage gpG-like protein
MTSSPDEFDVGDKMRRWQANLDEPSAALEAIGAMMAADSQQAFKDQRFGGEPWPPRRVPSVMGVIADFAAGKKSPPARRFEGRPALVDTGALRRSITYETDGKTVSVGSNLPYADTHQTGGPTESETITKSVQDLLSKWLAKSGKPWERVFRKYTTKKWEGETIKGSVPARPFVGLTDETEADIAGVLGVHLMEAE